MVAKIGYGRVSRDHNPDAQRDALIKAECTRLFIDEGVSGKLARRPSPDKALEFLRDGDTQVITKWTGWSLTEQPDRASRRTRTSARRPEGDR